VNNANRGYSVQGSDVLMTVFARPGVVRYVFRFPFDRYVEDVLFLLLFLASTSSTYMCVVFYSPEARAPTTKKISARVRPRSRADCAWRAGAMKTVRARETDGPRPSPDARRDGGTVRDTDFREHKHTPDVRSEVDARRSIVPTHTRARVEYPGC